MKKRKPQIRSEKCALVTLGVSFNIRDPEQAKDLEYADSLVNFSGDVKQWIRSKRLGSDDYFNHTQFAPNHFYRESSISHNCNNDFMELSDDDALSTLI